MPRFARTAPNDLRQSTDAPPSRPALSSEVRAKRQPDQTRI
ncbi:MAG: hypothetical protein AAGE92_02035 [Cyanobacteria bacterium P01_G01_bin.4]